MEDVFWKMNWRHISSSSSSIRFISKMDVADWWKKSVEYTTNVLIVKKTYYVGGIFDHFFMFSEDHYLRYSKGIFDHFLDLKKPTVRYGWLDFWGVL